MIQRISFALLTTAFLLSSSAAAQTYRGLIRGRVTDGASAPIPGVTLKVIQSETNETRTTTNNAAGEFVFSMLPPGPYRLEVEQTGYKKYIHQLELRVNQELRLDVALELGPLTEEIIITAPRATLKKDTVALGTVIENRQITSLPLDGRNFLELSLLLPGAVPAAPGSAGSVRGDFAFNINGAREDANNFLLDGVYNVDPKLNTFGVKPPVDAVYEFEILSGSYDASFGRNAGAQVNIVIKSGTNRLHGTAYEFFRNGALDARNFFAPADEPAPKYQRNQFGFSLGGPVIKDRLFFFADYEGTRVGEGITRVTNIPTLAERRGDFSQSPLPLSFPGKIIPPQLLHPVGVKIAALYPAPNRTVPFQNFVSSPTLRDRNDHFDVRVDQALGKATDLAFRYSLGDRDLFEPFSGPSFAAVPGFGTQIPRRGQNAMVSVTRILSSALINDARLAYNRVAAGSLHENMGRSLNREVGLPELSNNPRDFGLSFITVTGFSPLGDEFNNPQHSVTNVFQFLDTATYARGGHLLKVGFDFRASQQNGFRDVQARGFLNFTGLITGNPLADLLLGLPTITGSARLDNHQHLRTKSYNLFVNDSYRIAPRLTLSAGLRYEYNTPPVDAEDRANIYDPATRSLVRVGTSGIPRGGYEPDRNNFAPRLGLAWSLGRSENRVLRASYGIFYDQSALAPGEALYFNFPFFDFNLNFPLPQLPLTLSNPFPNNPFLALPKSALAIQRELRTPYLQHWNLNVQQQLGKNRVLEVGYVASKGTHLLTARDINQPRPSPQSPNPRPVPQFDDITMLESRAKSSYHSLQVRFQQRLDFGLSALVSYTYAKSLDDASHFFSSAGDPNFPQDSFNLRAEKGRSNFDLRQRLSISYSYDLPIGGGHRLLGNHGWLSHLLANWQSYGLITLQTGRPFTVALLPEFDNSNTGRANLGFGANDRPNLVGNPKLSRRTPEKWFETSAFTIPPFGSFGNGGRNIVDGPGFQKINFSLLKNIPLKEEMKLQFRAEFFNLFNHPNFDLPDNFVGSPTFGAIRSAQSPRRIQFGLKLVF